MNEVKRIALQNIQALFRSAKEKIREDPELAQRYVEIARRTAMRTKSRLSAEYRHMLCKNCKSLIYPNVNSRIRIRQKREPHITITCLMCGEHTRIPLRDRNHRVVGKEGEK